MGRVLRRVAVGAAVALLLLAGLFLAWSRGAFVTRESPEALASLLRPAYEVFRPPGDGPFPAVVQFHGCGGVFENQRDWARQFRDAGWVGVVVDSNGPRGLDWSDVCSGRRLHGSERAGDVLVAMADVRALDYVDPERIVLAGWSHGAWSIMDLLAMDPPEALPYNLAAMPPGGTVGLAGLVFVYPYCGLGARTEVWSPGLRALFVMAANDTVTPSPECLGFAEELRQAGHDLRIETIPDVDHAFDEDRGPESPYPFDAEATRRAHRSVLAFLAELGAR